MSIAPGAPVVAAAVVAAAAAAAAAAGTTVTVAAGTAAGTAVDGAAGTDAGGTAAAGTAAAAAAGTGAAGVVTAAGTPAATGTAVGAAVAALPVGEYGLGWREVGLNPSPRGHGLSICCVMGSGRLQGLLWRGIGLPDGLSGRTYSNEGGGRRRVWPARCLVGDAGWAGIQQRCKPGLYPGGVPRARRTMRRAPGPIGFRCRRWRANPVSIDSSSTYRGCSPNGHHPSSDLAVVVHLPSLVHVAAAAVAAVAAAVRLPSLDHVAAAARLPSLDHAAAAADGLPSVQHHLSLNPLRRPYSVRGWGISRVHLTQRHQS